MHLMCRFWVCRRYRDWSEESQLRVDLGISRNRNTYPACGKPPLGLLQLVREQEAPRTSLASLSGNHDTQSGWIRPARSGWHAFGMRIGWFLVEMDR